MADDANDSDADTPAQPAAPAVYVRRDHPRPVEGVSLYIVSTSDEPGIYHGTFHEPDCIYSVVNGFTPRPGVLSTKRIKSGLTDAIAR